MIRRGLSGSTLKLIAVITMLIDHIGAVVLARLIMNGGATEFLYKAYYTSRNIGRIAFPIYCFLLIEGFDHTKNRWKYAMRLGLFALISEIPFDLAFKSKMLEFGYQNVFFTLFIGLLTIMAIDAVEKKTEWETGIRYILMFGAAVMGMGTGWLFKTDYAAKGVWCIVMLYLFRKVRGMQILAGCAAFFWWELPALLAFIPIAFYDGRRGWNMKYLFYLFYPLHLLVLYMICIKLGVGGIAAV